MCRGKELWDVSVEEGSGSECIHTASPPASGSRQGPGKRGKSTNLANDRRGVIADRERFGQKQL